jgi:putative ABC transport system ATP-binding protein
VSETSATAPVVDVRRVVRTFDGDGGPVRALRDASVRVAAGEFVTVTGPSGCGKSTLLGLIAGLDVPDEGHVSVLGSPVSELSADDRARLRRSTVGMVFQFFNLVDTMTALENVALAAQLAGHQRAAANRRAMDLLDLLGIADKAMMPATALSGGQRQRLAIARALANSPAVLLADEPTGALDSAGGAEVLELLRRLNDAGHTIVMVTHDPAVAAAATRAVTMRDGRTLDAPHPIEVS